MTSPFAEKGFINPTETWRTDVYPAIDPTGALKGSVKGRSVLITGAGRGIGKATAIAFARAGAATIVITARSQGELETARAEILADAHVSPPLKVLTHGTDVACTESVDGLFAMLDAEGILPDVLVNNAGFLMPTTKLHETNPAEWWTTWEVNIKGTYLPTHALLKRRHASGVASEATIICTSSIGSGLKLFGMSAYQASKAAVNRFAELVHVEYADSGVRAFAYHPGCVMTKMVKEGMSRELDYLYNDTPELAAAFCVWLAGQRAADAFQGKYLSVNWDVDELVGIAEKHGADQDWLFTRPVFPA